MKSTLCFAAFAILALTGCQTTTSAPEAWVTSAGTADRWRVSCNTDQYCRAGIYFTAETDPAPLGVVANPVTTVPGIEAAILVRVPRTAVQSAGLLLDIEGYGPQQPYPFRGCNAEFCDASIGLGAQMTAALKRADTLTLLYAENASAPDVRTPLRVPLSGFAAAFAKASPLKD